MLTQQSNSELQTQKNGKETTNQQIKSRWPQRRTKK